MNEDLERSATPVGRFNVRVEAAMQRFNRLNTVALLFLLFCLNFLSFVPTDNEENYFALAKQYVDPDWIPGANSVTEFVGTRIVFQTLAGTALQYLSFEQLTFWGRMPVLLFYAFALARLFRQLRITNVEALFILQVFYLSHQSLVGGEWMIGGIESKTLAYPLVLLGISLLLDGSMKKCTAAAIAATYCHVLVGGWFFAVAMLYVLVRGKNLRAVAPYLFAYAICVLPYAGFLTKHVLLDSDSVIDGISLSWIYVYYRAPHHVGLFLSTDFFIATHLHGVLYSLACLAICALVIRRIADEKLQRLNTLNLIMLTIILVSVWIAYFDETGFYLRFYPFRQSVLATLIMLLEIAMAIRVLMPADLLARHVQPLLLLAALPALVLAATATARNLTAEPNRDFVELTEYARQNTDPRDVFLLLGYGFVNPVELTFVRRAERDRFSVYKFNPAGGNRLYDWFQRVQEKLKAETDESHVLELRERYRIDYLVTSRPSNLGALVYRNGSYSLYRLTE